MSKVAELAYDIEQLFIDGLHPTKIAKQLDCPLTIVYDWLESCSIDEEIENTTYNPFDTINS